MCIVAKRNVSSFEPLWCPLCQLSVSTQPATVEPLLYCLSLQSSNLYSGSVEAIESTESLPYGLQAFLFQYFLGVSSSPFHSRDHVLHAVCPFDFIFPKISNKQMDRLRDSEDPKKTKSSYSIQFS